MLIQDEETFKKVVEYAIRVSYEKSKRDHLRGNPGTEPLETFIERVTKDIRKLI